MSGVVLHKGNREAQTMRHSGETQFVFKSLWWALGRHGVRVRGTEVTEPTINLEGQMGNSIPPLKYAKVYGHSSLGILYLLSILESNV